MLTTRTDGERARRMPLKADVLLLRAGDAWACTAVDLSASGMSLERPAEFAAELDDHVRVEVLLSGNRTMQLVGKLARLDEELVGVEFSHIPEASEANLWGLLGEYADWVEALE